MSEPAKATTQYGDFTGTISLDGFEGLAVFDLLKSWKIPKGYWPVGINIYGFGKSEGGSNPLDLKAKVLCVDNEQVGGQGPDSIGDYCKSNDKLSTFVFDAEIDLVKLASAIKRIDIVLLSKIVGDVEVRRHNDRS